MTTNFEEFLIYGAGYMRDAAGVFRSWEDNSPLTGEQRAHLERIFAHPEDFVRVSREATPDFPATLPRDERPCPEFATDQRLIAVLSVDHHPVNLGGILLDPWVQASYAPLPGGLGLYAYDFSSPAVTYTHFTLLSPPSEDGTRRSESIEWFTNIVFNNPEAGHFATSAEVERILRAVMVEMALRIDGVTAACKRYAEKVQGV